MRAREKVIPQTTPHNSTRIYGSADAGVVCVGFDALLFTLTSRSLRAAQLAVAIAVGKMIVDQTDRLHKGVTNGIADESEAFFL